LNDIFDVLLTLQFAALHPLGLSAMVGTTAGSISGLIAQRLQTRRAKVLPYLPSHKEALTQKATEATRFFAAVHDMCMAVTEAWNATQSRRQNKGSVETLMKLDALLPACQTVKSEASQLRRKLAGYTTLDTALHELEVDLDSAWTYTNRDNYRTEHYTVIVQDSDGKSHSESRTRQVYQNTDHWFEYDQDAGQRAAKHGRRFVKTLQTSDLPTVALHTFRIAVDKIDEVERMFLRRLIRDTVLEDKDAVPTDEDLSHYVNQWVTGTRISYRLSEFCSGSLVFESDQARLFSTILNSQTSYHWRNSSRTHQGPNGYQAAQQALQHVSTARKPYRAVSNMLSVCVDVADDLSSWAQDHDEHEHDLQYAKRAVQAYEAAFPDSSIEVDQLPSTGKTLLWVFGTGVVATILVLIAHPDALMSWLGRL
jgi:hypothetical protein